MKIRIALASTAAVLVLAACVYFVTRTPRAKSPRMAAVESQGSDSDLADVGSEEPATEAARRSPVAEESPGVVAAALGTNVLRVSIEGLTEEEARATTVTVKGVEKRTFNPILATGEQWRAYVLVFGWPLSTRS